MDTVSEADAEERTTELVQLLPAEWRGADVTAASLEGLRTRDDCKPLLAKITRAVPLRLLVEQGPRSLHRCCEKEHLTPSHFFLSVPVKKLGAFVSHRWAADARQTASALTMHAIFHRGFILWGPLVFFWGPVVFLLYVWPPLVFLLMPTFAPFMVVMVKAVRSERGLRLLGLHEPNLWFDKACVHQTRDCLTQTGLHLFEHYLEKSDRLMILFQPSCARAPSHPPVSRDLKLALAPWHRFDEGLVLLRVRLVAEAQGRRQHYVCALGHVLDHPSPGAQGCPSFCGRFDCPALPALWRRGGLGPPAQQT